VATSISEVPFIETHEYPTQANPSLGYLAVLVPLTVRQVRKRIALDVSLRKPRVPPPASGGHGPWPLLVRRMRADDRQQ
jgi:hypothetical protein